MLKFRGEAEEDPAKVEVLEQRPEVQVHLESELIEEGGKD